MDDWHEEPEGEIRALSARVRYDGWVVATVAVPGEPDPVDVPLPGDGDTLQVVWGNERATHEVDLAGSTKLDRRVQAIVARGVACLNHELAQLRRRQRRAYERRRGVPR
jgi:hypothetical protein